jgi:hypothetical protein
VRVCQLARCGSVVYLEPEPLSYLEQGREGAKEAEREGGWRRVAVAKEAAKSPACFLVSQPTAFVDSLRIWLTRKQAQPLAQTITTLRMPDSLRYHGQPRTGTTLRQDKPNMPHAMLSGHTLGHSRTKCTIGLTRKALRTDTPHVFNWGSPPFGSPFRRCQE